MKIPESYWIAPRVRSLDKTLNTLARNVPDTVRIRWTVLNTLVFNVLTMVLKCPPPATTTYKGVLRYLGTVHAHEASFHVQGDFPGRPQMYMKYHSHLYRKHCGFLPSPNTESDDSIMEVNTKAEIVVLFNRWVSLQSALLIRGRGRQHCLFLRPNISTLDGVLRNFTTMLESTVHNLEGKVMAIQARRKHDFAVCAWAAILCAAWGNALPRKASFMAWCREQEPHP